MAEYTVLAVTAVVAVVSLELAVLRTGLFRRPAYWVTIGICGAFMVPVNGWLTKLSAPIVWYAPALRTGWRFPLDIPVEDFAFGFALLTLVLLSWYRAGIGGSTEDQP
ncbi:lycopene cyclase domain-containing protein [Rhabdothermincola sp.]|uniref:lycopene cyclase domain-containing protein n=1 Tax=Rhabdothermincola sp. TaxID=2820405 RepID=UPI002FDF14B2